MIKTKSTGIRGDACDGIFLISIFAIIIVVFSLALNGAHCERKEKIKDNAVLRTFFDGEHVLRKMSSSLGSSGHMEGSFFLLSGSISGNEKSNTMLSFAWKSNVEDEYIISEIPLNKVRVRFNDKLENPVCSFYWYENRSVRGDIDVDKQIALVIVYCKASDWPVNISLPLNKGN